MSARFKTRAALSRDFEEGVDYISAASNGIIDPGKLASEILAPRIDFGLLFSYCFRRFGFPNATFEHRKQLACYELITPTPGVYLQITLKANGATGFLFGYVMPSEMEARIQQEHRDGVQMFHEQYGAWRKAGGLTLPRDTAKDGYLDDGFDLEKDHRLMQEYLGRYRDETGLSLRSLPPGPVTKAALDALRATLEDLKIPTCVRDVHFSPLSENIDMDYDEDDEFAMPPPVAAHHPSSGYCIPADLMQDPELFMELTRKLALMGDGNLVQGVRNFLQAPLE